MKSTHLFFSTLKRALASFRLFSLVFKLMQNSTANSSTNFLFISLGSLQEGDYKHTSYEDEIYLVCIY